MTFDKKAYQRDLMRKRRAAKPKPTIAEHEAKGEVFRASDLLQVGPSKPEPGSRLKAERK